MLDRLISKRQQECNKESDDEDEFEPKTSGIIHSIATTKSASGEWENPVESGAISIRSSGLMHDSLPEHAIVGLHATRCVTKPVKNAWFLIEFPEHAICATHYTLRHYVSWHTEALRNWRLEGSLDGDSWTLLRQHDNDDSLRVAGQSSTWPLNSKDLYFCMFRIVQFAKNSNNHYYLALSGFELYGSVLAQNRSMVWHEWPTCKLHVNRARNSVIKHGSSSREIIHARGTAVSEVCVLVERSGTFILRSEPFVSAATSSAIQLSCGNVVSFNSNRLYACMVGGTAQLRLMTRANYTSSVAAAVPPPPPPQSVSVHSTYSWHTQLKSSDLSISDDGVTLTNNNSTDVWQGAVSNIMLSTGRHSFEMHIGKQVKSNNQWNYIVGVAPVTFDPQQTAWLGSHNSWGYIAGTGGVCHVSSTSVAYGKRFGHHARIKCQLDFDKKTIHFFCNEKSQGIAFKNLSGVVRPAVSMTGKGATINICNVE